MLKVPAISSSLMAIIRAQAFGYRASPALQKFIDDLLRQYGSSVKAVIYYGSCLQSGSEFDSLVDLYLIVEDYKSFYSKRPWLAFLNWILPPNVFYAEADYGDRRIRAKYAVLSMRDFRRKTGESTFQSYFWARFCQPVAVLYWRDNKARKSIEYGLCHSVVTFLSNILPCTQAEFTAKDLWCTGLRMSYSAELRPEGPERLSRLWIYQASVVKKIVSAAIPCLPFKICRIDKRKQVVEGGRVQQVYYAEISMVRRQICRAAWWLRRIQGKTLSVMRLAKAAWTFRGGVDYILWKIKRHSGVEVEVSPFLRRHPILAMLMLAPRLFSKGAVK